MEGLCISKKGNLMSIGASDDFFKGKDNVFSLRAYYTEEGYYTEEKNPKFGEHYKVW